MRHEEIGPPEPTGEELAAQQVEEEMDIEEQYAAHRAEQDRGAELAMQQARATKRTDQFSRNLMSFAADLARVQALEMFPAAPLFNERVRGMVS
jgi:hypothetical protein